LPSRAGYYAPRLDRRVFEIENFGLKAGVLNPKFSMNDPIGAEPRGISSKTYKMSGTTGQSPGVFTQIGIKKNAAAEI